MDLFKKELSKIWKNLYPETSTKILDAFLVQLKELAENIMYENHSMSWFKDAVVYSLYVDHFNNNFAGLRDKIPYLKNLGINCLWLLPILESPMKDSGFDISDYRRLRADLCVNENQDSFTDFLNQAHNSGLKVIFDIALNHTSNQHEWFKRSSLPEKNKYTDYYIWSENDRGYADARIIFKGMLDSNWEKHDDNRYYFHRFFEFQPDLNYKNPNVLLDMCRNLMYWIEKGVDGFRVDAIPYLWKEEGSDCENLEQTHQIMKFFRLVTDYLNPSVILLAEACQNPVEVVKYMGDGDECHACFHFPLMPQIYKAIAMGSSKPLTEVLNHSITPEIPQNSNWVTFLRCHDELSLESVYVNEADREYIYSNYCHKPEWDFRLGEGISARLSELFSFNLDKIIIAYSLILSLPGIPVIYYGDEFGKPNDLEFYKYQIEITGHDDARNLVRGKIDWESVNKKLSDHKSFESKLFSSVRKMIKVRNENKTIINGLFKLLPANKNLIIVERFTESDKYLIIHNTSSLVIEAGSLLTKKSKIVFGNCEIKDNIVFLKAFSVLWIKYTN